MFVIVVGTAALQPFSAVRLGGRPSFVSAVITLVVSFDLLSMVLLVRQFHDTGERRALALSWAYMFSLVVVAGYALAFPGVFGTRPILGHNRSTAPWLWLSWHTAFPVMLGLALAPWRSRWEGSVERARRRRLARASVAATAVAGATLVAGFVAFDGYLPVLIHGVDTGAMTRVAGPAMLPLVLAGTILAVLGGLKAARAERWAALAATAALADVVLTLFSQYRYSLGWYSGRSLTVVSAAAVLFGFLAEFSRVKRRLAEEGERLREILTRTHELERRQHTLLGHLTEGVVMQRADGQVVASNPAAEALLGLSVEQLAGRGELDGRWGMLDAAGNPLASTDAPAVRTLRTSIPVRNEIIGVNGGGGATRWLSVNTAVARNSGGEVDYVVSSMGDVTESHSTALAAVVEHERKLQRIRTILEARATDIAFQPIVNLTTFRAAGAEALARFSAQPSRPPNVWFAEADAVGLGVELELVAIEAALEQLENLPAQSYLSLNVSPAAFISPRLASLLTRATCDRLVLELTEHANIEDYGPLVTQLCTFRANGVRLAVDDAGAGFASLRHIVDLQPDLIKLDIALTRDIDSDPARRALAASLMHFGSEIGAAVIAEGIETPAELETLRGLGFQYGQGYHLGRPGSLPLASREHNDTIISEAA